MMPLRVIEFFAGIGCVHEAFEQSGLDFEIVARSENSERKNVCYVALWGNVPNLGDVTKIADLPMADFWHFSSPCQDLSVAGKRTGIHGKRSGLCWTMLELARIHRPRFALSENVVPFLGEAISSGYLAAWHTLGYFVNFIVASPIDVGIPHSRRRVFTLFSLVPISPASVECEEEIELYPFLFGKQTPQLDTSAFHNFGLFCFPKWRKMRFEKVAYKRCSSLTFQDGENWYIFDPLMPRKWRKFSAKEAFLLQGFRSSTAERAIKAIPTNAKWLEGIGDGLCAKLYAKLLRSIFAPDKSNAAHAISWRHFDARTQLTFDF